MSSDAARGRSPPSGVVPGLGRVAHVLRGAGEREHGIPFTSWGRCGRRFRGRYRRGSSNRCGTSNPRGTSNRHRTRPGSSDPVRFTAHGSVSAPCTARRTFCRNALRNCSGRGCRSPFPAVPTRFTLSSRKAGTKTVRGWCSCLSHKGEGTKGASVVAGPERPAPDGTARRGPEGRGPTRSSPIGRGPARSGPDGRGRGARPSSRQLGSASRAGRSRWERIGDHHRINAASGMAAVSSHIVARTPNSVPRPPARSAPSGRVP